MAVSSTRWLDAAAAAYRPFIAFTALDGSLFVFSFPKFHRTPQVNQAVWKCQVLGIFPPVVERSRDIISKSFSVSVCVPMLQV